MRGQAQRDEAGAASERLGERGASAVEFALVVPLLIALLLGIAQVGLVVMNRIAVTDAARDVARAVSLGRLDRAAARERLGVEIDRLLPSASLTETREAAVGYEINEEDDAVVVDVKIPLRILLWSPALGEAVGPLRVSLRTIKP